MTSADRPFTESERAFLEGVRDWGKKIVVTVNNADILKDLGKNNLFILQEDATLDEWRTLTPLLRWERSFRPSAP